MRQPYRDAGKDEARIEMARNSLILRDEPFRCCLDDPSQRRPIRVSDLFNPSRNAGFARVPQPFAAPARNDATAYTGQTLVVRLAKNLRRGVAFVTRMELILFVYPRR